MLSVVFFYFTNKNNNVIIFIRTKEEKKKMNKIYNNLNIENLTKTEWFNQFNKK